jgi:hypothetical protein
MLQRSEDSITKVKRLKNVTFYTVDCAAFAKVLPPERYADRQSTYSNSTRH